MARMYSEALNDLSNAGYPNRQEKRLHGGGGAAYSLKTPSGNQWVKVHTRGRGTRRRYWLGINFAAVTQVDAFAFWFKGEGHSYVVPAQFLKDVLVRVPKGTITVKNGQWHVDVYADRNELALPHWPWRFKLGEYAVRLRRPAD